MSKKSIESAGKKSVWQSERRRRCLFARVSMFHIVLLILQPLAYDHFRVEQFSVAPSTDKD